MSSFWSWAHPKITKDLWLSSAVTFGLFSVFSLLFAGPSWNVVTWAMLAVSCTIAQQKKTAIVLGLFSKLIGIIFGWIGNLTIGKYGWIAPLFFWGTTSFTFGFLISNQALGAGGMLMVIAAIIMFIKKQAG